MWPFGKKKEEKKTEDYTDMTGYGSEPTGSAYNPYAGVLDLSCDVEKWRGRYEDKPFTGGVSKVVISNKVYSPADILREEALYWEHSGYNMVEKASFTCGYCRTKFDGKDVEGTYNCPKCGAPITQYVKGY